MTTPRARGRSRSARLLLLALSLAVVAPFRAAAAQDCEPFALLLRDSGNGFGEIKSKGVREQGRSYTDLVWKLPGATECYLRAPEEDAPLGSLTCGWRYGHFADGAQVRTDARNLFSGAVQCLGPVLSADGITERNDAGGRLLRKITGTPHLFDFYVTADSDRTRGWELRMSAERTPES